MSQQALYIEALAGRATVYHIAGELKRSKADFEKVKELARDDHYRYDAIAGLGAIYSELGDYDQELSCANRLVRVTKNKGSYSKGKALMMMAGALRDKGDYELALKIARKSIALYRRANVNVHEKFRQDDPRATQESISNAYNTMGMIYNLLGNYGSALKCFKKSLAISQRIKNQMAFAQVLNNIGLIYWHITRFEDAKDYFEKSLKIAQKIGNKNLISKNLGNLGVIYEETEKPNTALEYLRKAIMISEEMGNRAGTANNLNNVSLCYADVYDLDNAIKYLTQSLNLNLKIGNRFGAAQSMNNLGMFYFEKGKFEKALICEKKAERIALHSNAMEIIIRCWTLKGRILRGLRKYAESIEILKKAVRLAGKKKMEDLRISAIMQYAKTAVEEKGGKYLAGMSKYAVELENALANATVEYDKCLTLTVLIRLDVAKKKYEEARKRHAELLNIVKRTGDKRFMMEALYFQAHLDRLAGKKYDCELMKARALALALGLKTLQDEMERMISKN